MDFENLQLSGVAKCKLNTWEWENSKVACATLSIYDSTLLMQDTQYPTTNLVMPQPYQMIAKLQHDAQYHVCSHRTEGDYSHTCSSRESCQARDYERHSEGEDI